MKTFLVCSALSLLLSSAFGQGRVNFQNSLTLSPVRNAITGRLVSAGDGILVALYWAPLSDPNNFTQLGNSVLVGGSPPIAGQFVGGVRTTGTQTAPGEEAWFQVRAWEAAYGATFEAAAASGAINGRPGITTITFPFRVATPGSELLPAASIEGTSMNPGFREFTPPIPEPRTILLGLVGLGSLYFFRRR